MYFGLWHLLPVSIFHLLLLFITSWAHDPSYPPEPPRGTRPWAAEPVAMALLKVTLILPFYSVLCAEAVFWKQDLLNYSGHCG